MYNFNYVHTVQLTGMPFMQQKQSMTIRSVLNNSQFLLTFYCSLNIKTLLSRIFVLVTEICLKEIPK